MGINKIILDCDPGHDDALAILLALASPDEIKCLGLTISAGNVSLELTSKNALRVLSLINNKEIPVYKGCPKPLVGQLVTAEHVHGKSGLDTEGDPIDILAGYKIQNMNSIKIDYCYKDVGLLGNFNQFTLGLTF